MLTFTAGCDYSIFTFMRNHGSVYYNNNTICISLQAIYNSCHSLIFLPTFVIYLSFFLCLAILLGEMMCHHGLLLIFISLMK